MEPMSSAALARALPIKASDFASACLTATVPRKYVRLVLVRVVATLDDGAVDAAQCRTVAFLFDARHPVTTLLHAARRTVPTSTLFYRRLRGAIKPVPDVPSSRSVDDELGDGGVLRGAMHTGAGGALTAYTRHCTQPARVCMTSATNAVRAHRGGGTDVADAIVAGLRVLGATNPTATIPASCACTGRADCGCFMARAVWRTGCAWLILYTFVPPAPETATDRASVPSAWVERLMANDASESVAPSFLDVVTPATWHRSDDKYLAVVGATSDVLQRRAAALLDMLDDDDSSSASIMDTTEHRATLPVVACVWACAMPEFFDALPAASARLSLFHQSMLVNVLATSRRSELTRCLLRVAGQLDNVDVLTAMVRARDGPGAVAAAVAAMTTSARCRRSVDVGYMLGVACAMTMFCQTHAAVHARAVNTWDLYACCPPLLV